MTEKICENCKFHEDTEHPDLGVCDNSASEAFCAVTHDYASCTMWAEKGTG